MIQIVRKTQLLSVMLMAGIVFPLSSPAGMTVAATATMSLTPQQRAQGLTVEDLENNSKKIGSLGTSIIRRAPSRLKFGGTMSYGLRDDLAMDRSPVIATHRMLLSGTLSVFDRPFTSGFDDALASEVLSLNATASGQFKTLDQEIQGNVQGGPVEFSDLDVSASRAFEFSKVLNASSVVDLSLGVSMPTSEASQYEGITAVPYANLAWALGFLDGRYNLSQSVSADYTVNKFEFSPTTREISSDSTVGYTASTSARLGAGFRFTVGGTARLIHHLDNTMTSALGNFQILSWTKGFATVTLRHTNGSRAEDHISSMWFIDEYRRIVSLGVSVRF